MRVIAGWDADALKRYYASPVARRRPEHLVMRDGDSIVGTHCGAPFFLMLSDLTNRKADSFTWLKPEWPTHEFFRPCKKCLKRWEQEYPNPLAKKGTEEGQ